MIRVFIYDDSQERRESLKSLFMLNDAIEVVGEAENCATVLKDIETHLPDVVLMDINMPKVDGIEGLQKIKTTFPDVKVLMQTAFDDSEKVFTCIKNGASGYILKRDSANKILQAIDEVYSGGAVMNAIIAQKVLDYFKPKQTQNPLSDKETKVLGLLAEGQSYKMVANNLGIGYGTVNTHAKHIYEKLHISSLGEAIAWYYKNLA